MAIEEKQVWEAMKECYDPEIPVNIVDLGLVYAVQVEPEDKVRVKMTLTARGCGMGPMIAESVREKLLAVPGVKDATVELVWDPPWTPEKMSEEARKQLGWA